MQNAAPDYKTLYEESQKMLKLAELNAKIQLEKAVQQITQEYEQKLELALLDARVLRARLFGIKFVLLLSMAFITFCLKSQHVFCLNSNLRLNSVELMPLLEVET